MIEIQIRFKRKNAQPFYQDKDYRGNIFTIYKEADLKRGRNFCGGHDFRCIPDFVTDKHRGDYIDLESTSEDYKKLLQMIEKSIEADVKEDPDYYNLDDDFLWFVESSDNTIFTLYALLFKAPIYEKFGWTIQLEAEWE